MRIFDHRRPKKMAEECGGNVVNLSKRRERRRFFQSTKANKRGRICGLRRETICGSWRSAPDVEAAEQINRKNTGVERESSSPNAKTHRRCAADFLLLGVRNPTLLVTCEHVTKGG